MKKIILALLLIIPGALLACNSGIPGTRAMHVQRIDSVPASGKCLSQSEAEKILGQPALLKERTSGTKEGRSEYKCAYMATAPDPKTNVTGNIYYVLEEYNTTVAAASAYMNIVQANRHIPGQTTLKGIGDEAYLHTDDKNFAMIICRKGNKMLRIKINKLTSMTSQEELLRFVKEFKFDD